MIFSILISSGVQSNLLVRFIFLLSSPLLQKSSVFKGRKIIPIFSQLGTLVCHKIIAFGLLEKKCRFVFLCWKSFLPKFWLQNFPPTTSRLFSTSSKSTIQTEFILIILSVIRKKSESQNGYYKKTMHAKFFEKGTFVTPWYSHERVGIWLKTVLFSENLACFVFL